MSASSASSTMMERPIIALRSWRSRRRKRSPVAGGRTGLSAGVLSAAAVAPVSPRCIALTVLAIADPGVEEGVDDVDDQVSEDEDHGDEEDDALHDGIVTIEDGPHQDAADAADGEDGFGDDGAAEQQSQLNADDRDHRNERVAQSVAEDDGPLWQPLGARCPHVVAAEDFEQSGADEAHQNRRVAGADGDAGE